MLHFNYFIMPMWPCISLERVIYWRWSLRKRSSKCHNNPVLVPPRKPPDPVKDIYDVQIYDLKTRVDIWTRIDVVPMEYGTFAQKFHLTMWFFQFITGITFKWYYVIGQSVFCWYGLVFGPNWEFIEFPQTQSDGIAEVLDFYGENSHWIGCYGPRMTSRYPTGSN